MTGTDTDAGPDRQSRSHIAGQRVAVPDVVKRVVDAGRAYIGAVLLNLALVQAVLSAPAPRPVAQVRVLAPRGQFHPLETVRGTDGIVVGILSRRIELSDPWTAQRLN